MQTIEYAHSERARELEAKSVGSKLSLEEQHTFGSFVRQAGTLMIAPSLLDHVKQEVEKMPNCQKIFGKAREERDLARKKGGETPAGHRLRGPGVIRRRLQELPFSLGTHVVCPGTFLLCRCQMSRSLVALAQCRLERNWHQASLVADCVRGLNSS